MSKAHPDKRIHDQRGFALVATVSLLVLLSVVVLGMLTLCEVSLRSASQDEAQAAARANARMALLMALGELQEEMGPDSRISAPADAGSYAAGGQPHWIAVYDAWSWQNPSGATPETPQSRTPTFRKWLVSGHDLANFDPANEQESVLILGPGSLGDGASASDQVRVPMQKVESGSTPGRIAWWTADESVKAKITAGPDVTLANSFGISDPLFTAQSPQNIGHRAFGVIEDLDWKTGDRAKTITTNQIHLAANLEPGALGNSIHDLTVHSKGLLVDVRSARLMRDLSNLLSRPFTELEDKPLFLADGRMNAFVIGTDGSITNSGVIGSDPAANDPSSRNEWGINLEELGLYHQLPSAITWKNGVPHLVMQATRELAVQDRFFIYKKPTVEGAQFILSFMALPNADPNLCNLQMQVDGLVSLANPNDINLEIPPGLKMPLFVLSIPYDLRLKINGTFRQQNTAAYSNVFKGYVGGETNPSGFVLSPGEGAAFGAAPYETTTTNRGNLDLARGFAFGGKVRLSAWPPLTNVGGARSSTLARTDMVDFEFRRNPALPFYYGFWLGPRVESGAVKGWSQDGATLVFGSGAYSPEFGRMMIDPIRPQSARVASDFINSPQPVLLLSLIRNVEQGSTSTPPDPTKPSDAFVSRPYLYNDPSLSSHDMWSDDVVASGHKSQYLFTAEPMNYDILSHPSLAAGAGGRNIYHGGGRQPNLGGSFHVIKRRIPLAPPLSLGAFQNAIAAGLVHIYEDASRTSMPAVGGDPIPANAVALSPFRRIIKAGVNDDMSPVVAKAIGNSFCPPYLSPDTVFKAASGSGVAGKMASDYSWMVNTALWDSWFLSGIVDGTGAATTPWQQDARSPRTQFKDFAEGKKPLRNKRFLYHPYQSVDTALDELFNGEQLKPEAIYKLSRYLMVDGAFNVNSTSVNAWAALLSSVRDQELLKPDGGKQKFNHPYGTLGLASYTATSGTEGDCAGLRDLSESEIKILAESIVAEVKERGPFVCLADFVNRNPYSTDPAHRALGALQSAINKSGVNDRVAGGGRTIASVDLGPLLGKSAVDQEGKPARSAGSPGYLSQADILTAVGPQITVRGDTFTIRAYGDVRNPDGTKILAKAWCEAVVQRTPDYCDSTDAPEAHNDWPRAGEELVVTNARFGRKFNIVSFRWLAANEV